MFLLKSMRTGIDLPNIGISYLLYWVFNSVLVVVINTYTIPASLYVAGSDSSFVKYK